MRKFLLPLAASLVIATPALANEARVEARGGVVWGSGNSEAIVGVAAGYDFDLGTSAFAGVEVSGDKILDSATKRIVFGFTGRAGVKASENDKVFATVGYATKPCALCVDSVTAGAGWEHNFGQKLYGKVEYRHFFTSDNAPDNDAVAVGLGVRF